MREPGAGATPREPRSFPEETPAAPGKSGAAPRVGSTPGTALVLIDPPEYRDPQMADTLRRLYGLTASEAELAAHLDEGLSPVQAADARGVRLSTVRSQIATVLQKTETGRLGDLTLGLVPTSGPSDFALESQTEVDLNIRMGRSGQWHLAEEIPPKQGA